MKTLLLLLGLLLSSSAFAQPKLQILLGGEYPDLPGLTGTPPHTGLPSAMTIVSWNVKAILFHLSIANEGDQAFVPKDIRPDLVVEEWWNGITLRAFWHFQLLTPQTNVVVAGSRTVENMRPAAKVLWDVFPIDDTAPPPFFKYNIRDGDPGLSPHRAAFIADPIHGWSFLDITDVPNGDYILRIICDPFGVWGQNHFVDVPLNIEFTQITFR